MAFELNVGSDKTDAGVLNGKQIKVACGAWFTCNGKVIPRVIKIEDENGEIQTITDIMIHSHEEKNYCGLQSIEYDCTLSVYGFQIPVKLIYFKQACNWVIREI